MSEPAPGALVTATIRLERLLGSGGMGSVWLAQHLTLRAQVVVKFMTQEYATNPEARVRFEREATLAAQAKSPNVVQVFDHGTSLLGLPYIAMELLEGEDLAKRIERDGKIDPRLFADWLTQACRGLGRAHAKGIIHRDVKPENIFLCDDDGRILVKLLDFGIAKIEAGASNLSGTQTGAMLGTAYYMSPEQTLGQKDVDQRADLWALGVVTYYALTGRRPFTGDTLGALAIAVTSAPLVDASSYNPRLGPGIDACLAKALARPRERRFQTAKEMAEAFEDALNAASLHATTLEAAPAPHAATLVSSVPPALPSASTLSPSSRSASGAIDAAEAQSSPKQRSVLIPVLLGALLLSLLTVVGFGLRGGTGATGAPSAVAAADPVASATPAAATSASAVSAVSTTAPSATTVPTVASPSRAASATAIASSASPAVVPPSAVRPASGVRATIRDREALHPATSATHASSPVTAKPSDPAPAAKSSATKNPLKMQIQ